MTATPTPLRELPANLRNRADESLRRGHHHVEWCNGVRFAANAIDAALSAPDALRDAAIALYNAGRWDCAALSPAEQVRLWENLRDALALPVGTATSLGVAALSARDEAGAVVGNTDPPPGWEPEPSPAEIEEGRALSATLAAIATPPASGEAGADTRRFRGVGELERTGYLPEGTAAEREATPPAASGDDVLAMLDHDIGVAKRRGDIAVSVAVEVLENAAALIRRLAAVAPAGMKWPERFACNGPQGTFWTDDAALANKLIAATFDRDDWTVTDTATPPATAGQE